MIRRVFLVAAVAAAVAVPAAHAADRLYVRGSITPDFVHLTGSYHISPPAGCPVVEPPDDATMAALNAWLSPRCQPYETQSADFRLTVRHNGRVVAQQSVIGDGAIGNPQQGGTIDARVWAYTLPAEANGHCLSGAYFWTVTLIDPFGRAAYNTSARGAFRCN